MRTTLRVLGVGLDASLVEALTQRLARSRPLLHVAPGLGAAGKNRTQPVSGGPRAFDEMATTPTPSPDASEMAGEPHTAEPADFAVTTVADLETALPLLIRARTEGEPFAVVTLGVSATLAEGPYAAAGRVWSVDHGVGVALALPAAMGEPPALPDKYAAERLLLWRDPTSATELAPMLIALGVSWAYSVDARRRLASADNEAAIKRQQFESERPQVTQVSKMLALGEMAAGIAHEINNPLTIIHGTCGLLRNFLVQAGIPPDHKAQSNVTRIEATSMRIASLVRGLREFARDANADPYVEVTVDKLLEQTAIICTARLRSLATELLIDPAPRGTRLDCRESQVIHVLLNLVHNACEAVAPLSDRWIRLAAKDQGDTVELSVEDSGRGIPERLVPRIFQPYFTTKEPGKGEGLGLSVAQAIVRAHRGEIFVDRTVTTTRFVVHLPKHHMTAEQPTQRTA